MALQAGAGETGADAVFATSGAFAVGAAGSPHGADGCADVVDAEAGVAVDVGGAAFAGADGGGADGGAAAGAVAAAVFAVAGGAHDDDGGLAADVVAGAAGRQRAGRAVVEAGFADVGAVDADVVGAADRFWAAAAGDVGVAVSADSTEGEGRVADAAKRQVEHAAGARPADKGGGVDAAGAAGVDGALPDARAGARELEELFVAGGGLQMGRAGLEAGTAQGDQAVVGEGLEAGLEAGFA